METMIINQQDKIKYNSELEAIILKVVNATAQLQKVPPHSELSILLVDNTYIKDLNAVYRHQKEATDVLSFAMNELTEGEPDFDFSPELNVLGDIVISLEKAESQAREYGHSLEREVGFLVAHGMLHLLGFDHDTKDKDKIMQAMQESVLHYVHLER